MSVEINHAPGASILIEKFPRIARFLEVESNGWVAATFHWWDFWNRDRVRPAELAAAYEEWAEFYEWRLAERCDELATNPSLRRILERDTDDMTYCCRRAAAYARGEDPGEWVPLWERRSDLAAERRADQLVGVGGAA